MIFIEPESVIKINVPQSTSAIATAEAVQGIRDALPDKPDTVSLIVSNTDIASPLSIFLAFRKTKITQTQIIPICI